MPFGLLNHLTKLFSTSPISSAVASRIGTGMSITENAQKATLAAGCFWGVEHLFRKNFANKGLLDARVGYIGGDVNSPSYRAVCSGGTGHAEAVQILFDPAEVSYENLVEFFFRMHDPTTENRQGPDVGTQYRSGIFTHSPEQESIANNIKSQVQKEWYGGKPICTTVTSAGKWWNAEDYHQEYLENNPGGYECPAHYVRNFSPLSTSSKI